MLARIQQLASMNGRPAQFMRGMLDRLSSSDRQWFGSFAVSTIVHTCLIVFLGFLIATSQPDGGTTGVDTRWTSTDELDNREVVQIETIEHATTSQSLTTGGHRFGPALMRTKSPNRVNISTPKNVSTAATALFGDTYATNDLSEEVSMIAGAIGTLTGMGTGTGDGDGDGGGFFGVRSPGKRFVYVVDCSGSMNYPHPSAAKTRFRRVKLELVRSIATMKSNMKFFIVFFNDQTIPMPARTLQPAILPVQKQYLYWMQKIRANRDTEPVGAIKLALSLKPDVVHFLTDGSFTAKAEADLLRLRKTRAIVNTYAFKVYADAATKEGVALLKANEWRKARRLLSPKDLRLAKAMIKSERVLSELAEKHGGNFQLIP